MDSNSGYHCWEIMNCDNLDCPARHETETPCWEIAKRNDVFHDTAKNCRDCVVYLLKANATAVSLNKLKTLIEQREFWEKIGTLHRDCIL